MGVRCKGVKSGPWHVDECVVFCQCHRPNACDLYGVVCLCQTSDTGVGTVLDLVVKGATQSSIRRKNNDQPWGTVVYRGGLQWAVQCFAAGIMMVVNNMAYYCLYVLDMVQCIFLNEYGTWPSLLGMPF